MIEINGIIDPNGKPLDPDTFTTKFLQWVESNDWFFAGGIGKYNDEDDNIGQD